MAGHIHVNGIDPLDYEGGERVTANGSAVATIPEDANAFQIAAEGGAVYYEINPSGNASAASPGYVPEDTQSPFEGPFSNLSSLKVFGGGATVYAHIKYYRVP